MKILFTLACCLFAGSLLRAADETRAMLIVVSEPGEARYESEFNRQANAWKDLAARGKFETKIIGVGNDSAGGDRELVEKSLTEIPKQGGDFWIVLIGHGSFDGRTANFNLRGKDIASAELRDLLKPFGRRLVMLNLFSASAPFLTELSADNRIIIGSTRSEAERNYSRFGETMADAIVSPEADLDRDGALSLLEATLFASAKVRAFYEDEQRVLQEHAVIDDNGDGVATAVENFKGLRAEAKDDSGKASDGIAARDVYFLTPTIDPLSPDDREKRAQIEAQIEALRIQKSEIPEDRYYRELEQLMRQMAEIYGNRP